MATATTDKAAGYRYTTQAQVRRAFWADMPGVTHRRTVRMGDEMFHKTDTRVAFVDWVDWAVRNGEISARLGQRVTL